MIEIVITLGFALLMVVFLYSGTKLFWHQRVQSKIKNGIKYTELEPGDYIIHKISDGPMAPQRYMICSIKKNKEKVYVKDLPLHVPETQKELKILPPFAVYAS